MNVSEAKRQNQLWGQKISVQGLLTITKKEVYLVAESGDDAIYIVCNPRIFRQFIWCYLVMDSPKFTVYQSKATIQGYLTEVNEYSSPIFKKIDKITIELEHATFEAVARVGHSRDTFQVDTALTILETPAFNSEELNILVSIQDVSKHLEQLISVTGHIYQSRSGSGQDEFLLSDNPSHKLALVQKDSVIWIRNDSFAKKLFRFIPPSIPTPYNQEVTIKGICSKVEGVGEVPFEFTTIKELILNEVITGDPSCWYYSAI